MRRILVWLAGVVGVLLILLALFLWFVHASLDSLVQTALEIGHDLITDTQAPETVGLAKPPLVLFGVLDLLGAFWTWRALKSAA